MTPELFIAALVGACAMGLVMTFGTYFVPWLLDRRLKRLDDEDERRQAKLPNTTLRLVEDSETALAEADEWCSCGQDAISTKEYKETDAVWICATCGRPM